MNLYLTLQIAHSYLYSGNRRKFWKIFSSVLSMATSTLNFPEAIHPLTSGGIMGDGHHGWAAAEIASAARDAFVYERNYSEEVFLLHGIPPEWFDTGKEFIIKGAPLSSGKISINVTSLEEMTNIRIDFHPNKDFTGSKWILNLPFKASEVIEEENKIPFEYAEKNETKLCLQPKSVNLKIYKPKVLSPEAITSPQISVVQGLT